MYNNVEIRLAEPGQDLHVDAAHGGILPLRETSYKMPKIELCAKAREAWPYLARRANSRGEAFTYKELGEEIGVHLQAKS